MGLRLKGQEHGSCFFVTTTFKDWAKLGAVDGFYRCLAESLRFCCEKYGARLIAYALMPSHVHLISIDGASLADLMRDFKKYTAQKVAPDFGIADSGIWMPRYDRVAIYSEDVLRTKLEYMHNNPIKSGLVERQEQWEWSSAKDYLGTGDSTLPVYKDWC